MTEGCEAAIRSIEDCISVLQGDLHQPGTPAIVLKLAASWHTVKTFLSNYKQLQEEQVSTIGPRYSVSQNGEGTWSGPVPPSDRVGQELAASGEQLQTQSSAYTERLESNDPTGDPSGDPSGVVGQQDNTGGPSGVVGQQDNTGGPSATVGQCVDAGDPSLDPSTAVECAGDSSVSPSLAVENAGDPSEGTGDPSMDPSSAVEPGSSMGKEYQKVEYPVLYYHKSSGYYYDPSTQQFFAPSSYYQDAQGTQEQQNGEGRGVGDAAATDNGSQPLDYNVSKPTQDYNVSQPLDYNVSKPAQDYNVSQPLDYNVSKPTQDYNVSQPLDYNVNKPAQDYNVSQPAQDCTVSKPASSGQTSIADMLAAASDRALDRCGYQYDEYLDMFYDASSNLYYHQESKLYYDADLGCFYEYDFENKKYSVHSRVKLPDTEGAKRRGRREARSSSPEFEDTLEEGEIRLPHIPRGSPPPEEDWAPCIRAVITASDKLTKGTLFVITQDGASIGREPVGSKGTLIAIPELKVSKLHAEISYDKCERSFMIQDLGSVNGTFLNTDQRLCESKEKSQPCPLIHGHTLTLGSTTLSLHIHNGWETCAWCDPSRARGMFQADEVRETETQEELSVQRRKELNRIKKKYGLRVKDTYGEGVALQEGYSDRSEARRRTVGSDMPYESQRPDDSPASVNDPITTKNKGRRLLEGMGWKEGEGLGKTGEGIRDPVRGEIRDTRAGLGTANSSRSLDSVGESHSTMKRSQSMRNRFNEVVCRQKASKKQRLE